MENQIEFIVLDAVNKTYEVAGQTYPVLVGVDYTFCKGGFNVILGKSGSGKTTLLKIIGGLMRPTSGNVSFKGQLLNELSFSDLAKVRRESFGYMFQEAGLLSHLTNGENILFPQLETTGSQLGEIASYFGISECLNKYPNEISLGEKQRVSLARALIRKPECVIADEPTANLDWANAEKTMELLRQYSQTGVTVFVATHDERMTDFATSVLKIEKGQKARWIQM